MCDLSLCDVSERDTERRGMVMEWNENDVLQSSTSSSVRFYAHMNSLTTNDAGAEHAPHAAAKANTRKKSESMSDTVHEEEEEEEEQEERATREGGALSDRGGVRRKRSSKILPQQSTRTRVTFHGGVEDMKRPAARKFSLRRVRFMRFVPIGASTKAAIKGGRKHARSSISNTSTTSFGGEMEHTSNKSLRVAPVFQELGIASKDSISSMSSSGSSRSNTPLTAPAVAKRNETLSSILGVLHLGSDVSSSDTAAALVTNDGSNKENVNRTRSVTSAAIAGRRRRRSSSSGGSLLQKTLNSLIFGDDDNDDTDADMNHESKNGAQKSESADALSRNGTEIGSALLGGSSAVMDVVGASIASRVIKAAEQPSRKRMPVPVQHVIPSPPPPTPLKMCDVEEDEVDVTSQSLNVEEVDASVYEKNEADTVAAKTDTDVDADADAELTTATTSIAPPTKDDDAIPASSLRPQRTLRLILGGIIVVATVAALAVVVAIHGREGGRRNGRRRQKTDKMSALAILGFCDSGGHNEHGATHALSSYTLAMENDSVEEALAAFGADTDAHRDDAAETLLDDSFVDVDDIDVTYSADFPLCGGAQKKSSSSSTTATSTTSTMASFIKHLDAFKDHANARVKRLLAPSSDWEIFGLDDEQQYMRG